MFFNLCISLRISLSKKYNHFSILFLIISYLGILINYYDLYMKYFGCSLVGWIRIYESEISYGAVENAEKKEKIDFQYLTICQLI